MVRRVLIGLVCGTVSSPFLCLAVRDIGLGVVLGALLGLAQIFAFFDLRGGSAIDTRDIVEQCSPSWSLAVGFQGPNSPAA
jgi:hypothetical protein